MTQLLAWVWAPLLLFAVALGVGLLVDRLLRAELPGALVIPVGLATTVLLATLAYRARLPGLVAPALALTAAAGLLLGRAELRRALATAPLIAAGAVYALYLAPVALSGTATWLGYNFVNDTASNFILVDLLESSGVKAPTEVSGADNIARYLIGVGYPLGSFSLVAGLRPLTGVALEAVYQPLIAATAAVGAMSLTELARRVGLRPLATVVASALPFGGVLLYRYALHGAVKEVLLVALLITAVALACVALERRLELRVVVLVALVSMVMVLVFSSAAGLFALCLVLAAVAAVALSPDRPSTRQVARLAGVSAVVGAVALIPLLGSVLDFTQNIRGVFDASSGASTGALGQLARPLPVTEAAGVWVSREYRYPADGPLNDPLVAAAVLAAAVGLVLCVVRRWVAPLLLVAATLVPALLISPLASPYIDAKMLVLLTPVLVFLGAIAGLSGLQATRPAARVAGGLLLAALVVGVGLSDLYSYREVRIAPAKRIEAMKDVAAHAPGRGLYLLNEWEEYGKVFMDAARINPAAESDAPRRVRLRADQNLSQSAPRTPVFGEWFDLDLQTLDYVDSFAGVIMRRSPSASRPPASFRKTYANDFYELWRRDPSVRVREHLSLQSRDRATAVPDCAALRQMARRARPGDRLVAAGHARVARLSPLQVERPPGWPVSGDAAGTVTTAAPGTLRGTLGAAGLQRLWVRASASRALSFYVDGRRVGQAKQVNTPGQWIDVGLVRLRPGAHRIEVRRDGASWRPGDSVYGYLGPIALEAQAPERLVSVPPGRAGELCGRSWDWVERVAGAR